MKRTPSASRKKRAKLPRSFIANGDFGNVGVQNEVSSFTRALPTLVALHPSVLRARMPPTLPIDQLMKLIRLDGDLRTRLQPGQWAALDQLHQLYQVRPPPGVLLTGAALAAALLTRAAAVLCLFCAGEPS